MSSTSDPLRNLLTKGAPSLERPAATVTWPDATLAAEIAALHAALDAFRARHGFGRGIAAPQLGINKRCIALHLDGTRFTLVNPQITWRSVKMFELWDDCMSVPGIEVRVRRHESISVTFSTEKGDTRTWPALAPEPSELLQHEIDHLDGILMPSRAVDEHSVRRTPDHGGDGAARPRAV